MQSIEKIGWKGVVGKFYAYTHVIWKQPIVIGGSHLRYQDVFFKQLFCHLNIAWLLASFWNTSKKSCWDHKSILFRDLGLCPKRLLEHLQMWKGLTIQCFEPHVYHSETFRCYWRINPLFIEFFTMSYIFNFKKTFWTKK